MLRRNQQGKQVEPDLAESIFSGVAAWIRTVMGVWQTQQTVVKLIGGSVKRVISIPASLPVVAPFALGAKVDRAPVLRPSGQVGRRGGFVPIGAFRFPRCYRRRGGGRGRADNLAR